MRELAAQCQYEKAAIVKQFLTNWSSGGKRVQLIIPHDSDTNRSAAGHLRVDVVSPSPSPPMASISAPPVHDDGAFLPDLNPNTLTEEHVDEEKQRTPVQAGQTENVPSESFIMELSSSPIRGRTTNVVDSFFLPTANSEKATTEKTQTTLDSEQENENRDTDEEDSKKSPLTEKGATESNAFHPQT